MVDKAERFATIHDAVLASSYCNFLERSFSEANKKEHKGLKGLFKCEKCGSLETDWKKKSLLKYT